MLKNDPRVSLIRSWLTRDLGWRVGSIDVASADASFRRYFRVSRGDVDPAAWAPRADHLIVMDAPPGKEDIAPFLKVSTLLEQAGAHVPHVYASDIRRGFVVMEDLGNTQYLEVLRAGRGVDKLYGDALATLANIQVRGARAAQQLAPYDREPLERELNLFPEWFLQKHLGLELTPEERALITVTNEILINEAMIQPQVFVHRDFHSRNLMLLPKGGPGVIDFQDALRGPVGYDLVSLLKDCYISWSRERVERWVRGYRHVLQNLGANVGDSEYQFLRWFDLIGVQRHLKVLGVFCRLWYRDGKPGYLNDLPLVFEYVRDACARYKELVEFGRWLDMRIAPLFAPALAREQARAVKIAAAKAARAAAGSARRRKPAKKSAKKVAKKPKRKPTKAKPSKAKPSTTKPTKRLSPAKTKTATRRPAKRKSAVRPRKARSRAVAKTRRAAPRIVRRQNVRKARKTARKARNSVRRARSVRRHK